MVISQMLIYKINLTFIKITLNKKQPIIITIIKNLN